MFYLFLSVLFNFSYLVSCEVCEKRCPEGDGIMSCGFDPDNSTFKMFPSECARDRHIQCFKADLIKTPLKYCIKHQTRSARKMFGESCPAFCPEHYRPVCGANSVRSYVYRTFNNGCFLDMVNCRGDEDFSAYVEVPLDFCQRHLMKNIFQEKVILSNVKDYRDYN